MAEFEFRLMFAIVVTAVLRLLSMLPGVNRKMTPLAHRMQVFWVCVLRISVRPMCDREHDL
jgi:hypothetical protein